jgi:hypothetical protein
VWDEKKKEIEIDMLICASDKDENEEKYCLDDDGDGDCDGDDNGAAFNECESARCIQSSRPLSTLSTFPSATPSISTSDWLNPPSILLGRSCA